MRVLDRGRTWGAVALALVLAGSSPEPLPRQSSPVAPSTSPAPTEPPVSGPEGAEVPPGPVTLAFAGDVHFEGRVADLLDDNDSTVGRLSGALREADVAVVNLESALTTGGSRAAKELEDAGRRYWFRSPPAALDVLSRSGVDVVSMANNHGADYGASGLRDTLEARSDSDVAIVGIGDGREEAYRPYRTSVRRTSVAVLAGDASPRESDAAVWDVGRRGPGLAGARDDARLLAAVREADADSDVVAVYLHWGAENVGCPTRRQQSLAQRLADAGADVVVGSHAHVPMGAGMLGDTYVSYGLGNFLWYHGNQPDTGVLTVEVSGGAVVDDRWTPGTIPDAGGPPRALRGSARADAREDWRDLRKCTDLAPGPGADPEETRGRAEGLAPSRLPAYASSIRSLPTDLRRRMVGRSHRPGVCPVDLDDLRLLTVGYVGFDGDTHNGQLVVHEDHARDVTGVFGELYRARFPIARMRLVDAYDGDDDRSMAADNTSAYNCRTVAGQTNLSRHAYGAAVDVNPVENPYLTGDDVAPRAGRTFAQADRSAGSEVPRGVVVADDVVVRAFAKIGWTWGGTWTDPDYQHFQAS